MDETQALSELLQNFPGGLNGLFALILGLVVCIGGIGLYIVIAFMGHLTTTGKQMQHMADTCHASTTQQNKDTSEALKSLAKSSEIQQEQFIKALEEQRNSSERMFAELRQDLREDRKDILAEIRSIREIWKGQP